MNNKKVVFFLFASLFCLVTQSGFANDREMQNEFNFFDENHDKEISFDEFFVIMMHRDIFDIRDEFYSVDSNNNGVLSFAEIKKLGASKEEFNDADRDQNSELSLQEFVNGVLEYIFKEIDLNKNQKIDFSEFSDSAKDEE